MGLQAEAAKPPDIQGDITGWFLNGYAHTGLIRYQTEFYEVLPILAQSGHNPETTTANGALFTDITPIITEGD